MTHELHAVSACRPATRTCSWIFIAADPVLCKFLSLIKLANPGVHSDESIKPATARIFLVFRGVSSERTCCGVIEHHIICCTYRYDAAQNVWCFMISSRRAKTRLSSLFARWRPWPEINVGRVMVHSILRKKFHIWINHGRIGRRQGVRGRRLRPVGRCLPWTFHA